MQRFLKTHSTCNLFDKSSKLQNFKFFYLPQFFIPRLNPTNKKTNQLILPRSIYDVAGTPWSIYPFLTPHYTRRCKFNDWKYWLDNTIQQPISMLKMLFFFSQVGSEIPVPQSALSNRIYCKQYQTAQFSVSIVCIIDFIIILPRNNRWQYIWIRHFRMLLWYNVKVITISLIKLMILWDYYLVFLSVILQFSNRSARTLLSYHQKWRFNSHVILDFVIWYSGGKLLYVKR